jgi:purine-binding chemotaxis protein CheW
MDILKARQKAKEQKAKAAAERERQAELEADLGRSAAPAQDEPVHNEPEPTVVEPARARQPSPRSSPLKIDPLRDFLAIYDDGEHEVELIDDVGELQPMLEDERRFLSFDLAGEAYAASIMDIREILTVVTLTEVPRAPKEVLGVLSKRGVVMPVADLAAVLGLRAPDKPLHRDQRVLVVGDGERVCGLRVDRVRQVVRLAQRAIEDVPPGLGNKNAHMLLGLGRARVEGSDLPQMLILLDVPAVLAHFAEAMGIAAEREKPR